MEGIVEESQHPPPMSAPTEPIVKPPLTAEEQKVLRSIKRAFDAFDQAKSGTCDVREVGTIIRSLNMNPSEEQLFKLIQEMEEAEPTGYIMFEKLALVLLRVIMNNELPRDEDEKIYRAFMVLDVDRKGFITAEDLRVLMTTHGEKFTQEEMDEMLAIAADPEDGKIYYEDYVNLLVS